MKKIVVATKNQGKIKEMIKAFNNLPVELISLSEFGQLPDAIEDGTSFKENAEKKARFYAKLTGYACLADDSGLMVDVLNGAPGVYSARFAGEDATDDDNNQKMLSELANKNCTKSSAQYVCALCFVDQDGTLLECYAKSQGIIRNFAQGNGGFGYDPYFFVPELNKTMAELSIEEKNQISHRGQALILMEKLLKDYL